jgi:hypothetical protein
MRRLAIQNLLKCTGTLQIFIDPHWYFILDTGLILRYIDENYDFIHRNVKKNRSKVRFVESGFGQKVRSTFPITQCRISSPFQWRYCCLLLRVIRAKMLLCEG